MEIFKVYLTLHELTELYALMYEPSDVEGFWNFVRVYRKSDVYRIPSGILRMEPYPGVSVATIHGIFHSNPFYSIQLIKDVLDSYMKERPWLKHLECIVPNEAKGLLKLAHKITNDVLESSKMTTFYWR